MALREDKQAGFFLWETMLVSIVLLAMAGAVGLYAQAALLRQTEAVAGQADYLARAQISYAQAVLARDGALAATMEYLGDSEDLQLNNTRYHVKTETVEEAGLWQMTITVSWEANGRYGEQEYKRYLVRR